MRHSKGSMQCRHHIHVHLISAHHSMTVTMYIRSLHSHSHSKEQCALDVNKANADNIYDNFAAGHTISHTAQASNGGYTDEELLLSNQPHSPGVHSSFYGHETAAVLPISTKQLLCLRGATRCEVSTMPTSNDKFLFIEQLEIASSDFDSDDPGISPGSAN
ncbi:TPA: hypothetical protein ACH3X1_010555 [Trebouxia sp. C0004]